VDFTVGCHSDLLLHDLDKTGRLLDKKVVTDSCSPAVGKIVYTQSAVGGFVSLALDKEIQDLKDINALIAGFKSYHEKYTEDHTGRYGELAEYGPHSKILMIACCDSRVDPAIITNSQAGDLMVIRNMANLVPPYKKQQPFQETQAAIEFAVSYLSVENIIIMGHSRCAGIRSLLTRLIDGSDPVLSLDKWTAVAEPAARQVLKEIPHENLDEQSCACSRKALVASLDNIKEYPGVADRIEKNLLHLHGWYFNLATGELDQYGEGDGSFRKLF
jgi:carbonic anhydrase